MWISPNLQRSSLLEAAEPFQMLPCQSLQSLRLGHLHDLDGARFFWLITMGASPWNKLQN